MDVKPSSHTKKGQEDFGLLMIDIMKWLLNLKNPIINR